MKKWEILTAVLLICLMIFSGIKYYTLTSTPCLKEEGKVVFMGKDFNVTECDYIKLISYSLLTAMLVAAIILIVLIRKIFQNEQENLKPY